MANTRELAQFASFVDFTGTSIGFSTQFNVSGVSTFTNTVIFDSTGSIQIPKGTTGQRLSGVLGQIRYNTSLSQFEGYGAGNAWGSLGGVKDVDGDTFIRAESAAGEDEDVLEFLTGNSTRLVIDSTGKVGIGSTLPTAKLDVNGTLNVSGVSTFQDNVHLGDNDVLKFGDHEVFEIYSTGTSSIIKETGSGNLKILGNNILLKNAADSTTYADFNNGGSVELYYDNSKKFETTGIGVSILNGVGLTATIAGPSNLIIDPGTVGDNTGIVRIKGDLFVDGTTTQINSTTLEIADFIVGVATTATSDLLTDGAGIGIGSDKTFLYEHNGGTNPSLKSSENLNVASGKVYQVDQTEVLSATTLGSGVVNSSLTNLGTLTALTVSGAIDANGDLDVDGHTELDDVNISGIATFASNVDINADLDVDGTVALGSSVYDTNDTFGTDGQVLSNVTGFGVSWTTISTSNGIKTDANRNHYGIDSNASDFDGTATDNVLFGHEAGSNITTGDSNVIIGSNAGDNLTTGNQNTFIGHESGGHSSSAIDQTSNNTAIGYRALYSDHGGSNTAVGSGAGENTGTSSVNNVFIGVDAGKHVDGNANVAIGRGAIGGSSATGGSSNVCIGPSAGNALTGLAIDANGRNNLMGSETGKNITTGDDNTFIGHAAGINLTTGDSNTFIGSRSGGNFTGTSDTNNVAVGRSSGAGVSGSDNTIIGCLEYPASTVMNGQVAIGAGATELIRINETGLGIGTDNPSAKLDVVGLTKLDDVNVSGASTFAGHIDVNGDLDVDGHTELDNVNISGVLTAFGGIDAIGIQSGGVNIATGIITALNFIGAGNTFAVNGNVIDISIAGLDGSTTRSVNSYTATADQTLFPSSGTVPYDVGYIDVYLNGSKLLNSTDFTATNGTNITLTTGATVGDIVELIAFDNIDLTDVTVIDDTTPQLGGDLDLNNHDITGTGNLDITGFITATTFDGNLTGNVTGNLNSTGVSTVTTLKVGTGITAEAGIITATSFSFSNSATLTSSNSFVLADDSGTPEIRADVLRVTAADGHTNKMFFGASGTGHAVRLYAGGSEKFTTASNGIYVQGTVGSNGGANITGVVTATSFAKSSNSGGFLKADGTEDTNTYLTSYTETQTLDDVLVLGNTSSTGLSVGVVTASSMKVEDLTGGRVVLTTTGGELETQGALRYSTNLGLRLTQGDLNVAGVITATSFYGDGSNITGISTLNITDYGVGLGGGGGGGGGGDVEILEDGSSVGAAITAINFSTNLIAIASGGIATITASGAGIGGNPISRTSNRIVATGGQTVFNGTYTVGFVDVFLNGSKLDGTEFTASNGTSITLTTGATANDVIEIIGYVFAQGSTNVELSNDGSPELAANLDLKGFDIVDSVGGGTLPGQIDTLEMMLFV